MDDQTYTDSASTQNEAERLADGPLPGNNAAEAGAMAGADPNSVPGDHTPDQILSPTEDELEDDDELGQQENDALVAEETDRQVANYTRDNESGSDQP